MYDVISDIGLRKWLYPRWSRITT